MFVNVAYNNNCANMSYYHFYVEDQTTGVVIPFNVNAACNDSGDTVEWVYELPRVNGALSLLSKTDNFSFYDANSYKNGAWEGVGYYSDQQSNYMTDVVGNILAYPGSIINNNAFGEFRTAND